jgi:hypothetical protein
MAHALNLTMRIRQDATAMATLAKLKQTFATDVQPAIDAALRESNIVHFARVLIIEDKYLQVLTEYDGDHDSYTEFFRKKLPQVFALLFSMAENPPNAAALGDEKAFRDFAASLQVRALGDSPYGDTGTDGKPAGYLSSAYGDRAVAEIKPLLAG